MAQQRIGLKRPLHNHGIDPAAELQADALEGTDGSEVVRNMEANRRNVAVSPMIAIIC